MVPTPATMQHQHGWQRGWRHQGMRAAINGRSELYHTCRPLTALPNGNTAVGSTPAVSVLDRGTGASTTASTTPGAPREPPPPGAPLQDRTMGYLSLATVPIIWGTYSPCIRYLYAEPDPLDPASLTAVRTALSAGALLLPALVGYLVKVGRETWRRNQVQTAMLSSNEDDQAGLHGPPLVATTLAAMSDGAAEGTAAATAGNELIQGNRPEKPSSRPRSLFAEPMNRERLGPILTRTFDSVILGGLELGLLNFLGTALQVEGLHSISATRAGFLAEVTAVLTPLVSYLAGYTIPRQMWLAVSVGLVGSTMVAYDTSQAHESQTGSTSAAAAPATAASAPAQSSSLVTSPNAATQTAAPSLELPTAGLPEQGGVLALDPSFASDMTDSATAAALHASESSSPVGPGQLVVDSMPSVSASVAREAASASFPADLVDASEGLSDAGTTAVAAASASASAAANAANEAIAGVVTAATAAAAASSPMDAANVVDTGELTRGAITVFATSASDGDLTSPGLISAAAEVTARAMTPMDMSSSAAGVSTGVPASLLSDTALTSIPAITNLAVEAAGTSASDGAAAATFAASEAITAAASAATPLAITGGEAYLLLACLFYSICTVRMGIYAPRMDTVSLAAMKKVGLSSMSLLWMAATNLQNGVAPGAVLAFPDLSSRTPISIAVLMYSGLGPGALATFLQVTGLSTVPATTAQVIYSMTPLCTAFFAYLILGGEATGPVAWAGGSLIIIAALMAADAQQKQYREQLQQQQQ